MFAWKCPTIPAALILGTRPRQALFERDAAGPIALVPIVGDLSLELGVQVGGQAQEPDLGQDEIAWLTTRGRLRWPVAESLLTDLDPLAGLLAITPGGPPAVRALEAGRLRLVQLRLWRQTGSLSPGRRGGSRLPPVAVCVPDPWPRCPARAKVSSILWCPLLKDMLQLGT